MARLLDSVTRNALAERLRFYRELGLTDLYRRPIDDSLPDGLEQGAPELDSEIREEIAAVRAPASSPHLVSGGSVTELNLQPEAQQTSYPEESAIPPRKNISVPPQIGSAVAPEDRSAALLQIVEEIGDCKRCPLHKGRHTIVFGQGDPNARLMFIGEGPGADEDAQGLPFVGRAGQLLNNMISAMGLKREETYICNVVKCRPPGNRTPEPEEANTCSPFLFRQIDVVRPQVMVALGATAATYLLGQRQPLAGLRGRVHAFRGSSLIVTYHPAYLLRDPRQKKEAWADLQIAMKELGLKAPTRS